jgi:hypothetical protein
MRNPDNRPIDDLVFDCCRELFSAYHLETHPRDRSDFPATEELAVCGVMGFGGKLMRGALVLVATREPLQHTNPDGLGSERDWVCELANQLMGRIKNRLLSLGVEILLATPAGLSGVNLSPTTAKLRAPQVFSAANGFVCVWIDYECAAGFELREEPLPSAEVALPEGETLLF